MIKKSTLEAFHQRTELINQAIQEDKAKKQVGKLDQRLPEAAKERFEIEL